MEGTRTFEEVEPEYSLRHYQREAVVEAWDNLKNHGRVLLHAPTGSGKTRMAMSVVSMHLRERGPTMVLWLAPTSELIAQAASAFQKAWRHHGDSIAVVIQWWGEGERLSHSMALDRNTVLVAGVQMAVSATETRAEGLQLLRDRTTLIVFDEAHQSVAPTYRSLVERILATAAPSKCLLLGLSATPGRADPAETAALAEMYGERKVGVAEGRNPVKFLVSQGYLAEANIHVRPQHGSPPPSESDLADGSEYSEMSLSRLGAAEDRNEAIISLVQELKDAGHARIMAFTPSVASAKWCADKMRQSARYSHAIVGETSPSARAHILDTFRTPVRKIPLTQVIFNCRVLTAGVDLPLTSAVVIGKPTKSQVLLQQMIGRALRGPKSGGNKAAEVWILADDTYHDFGELAALYSQWDELWEPNEA